MLRTEEQILKEIDWEIRSRVMAIGRFKKLEENKELCCNWGIQDMIFCKQEFIIFGCMQEFVVDCVGLVVCKWMLLDL